MKIKFTFFTLLFTLLAIGKEQLFASSPFEKEKLFIDSSNIKKNIGQVVEYTMAEIRKNNDPLFEKYHYKKTLNKDKPPSECEAYYAIYEAFVQLEKLCTKENPDKIDLLKCAEQASLLLSPSVFENDYSERKDLKIYSQVRNIRNLSSLSGKYKRINYDAFLKELKSEQEKYSSLDQEYIFICQNFTPLVFTGKHAVFSKESYLYALSKGILLYGLSYVTQGVHGNLFSHAIELFLHDQLHYSFLFKPKFENTVPSNILISLSHHVYSIITRPNFVKKEDYEKVIVAAFFLFHENSLSPYKFCFVSLKQAFATLKKSMEDALKIYFQSKAYTPTSTIMEKERKTSDSLDSRDRVKKSISAETVCELVELYKGENVSDLFPGLYADCSHQTIEEFIYGTKKLDRTIYYNGPRALQLSRILLDWFSELIEDKITG